MNTDMTFEEFVEKICQAAKKAADGILPWQAALAPGDCFVRHYWTDGVSFQGKNFELISENESLTIYGQVIESDYEEDRMMLADRPDLLLGKFWSVKCLEGETSTMNRAFADQAITKDELDEALRAIGATP